MKDMRDLHPSALAVFFAAVLIPTLFFSDPLMSGLSLAGGLFAAAGVKKLKISLPALVLIPAAAVINPLFSHRGSTELFFVNDAAYTLEALINGAVTGLSAAAAIVWCVYLSVCFDDAKINLLIGKRAPKTALVMSQTLRIIPDTRRRYVEIRDAARLSGRYDDEKFIPHLRSSARVWSALADVTFDDAKRRSELITARGYGGKTRYVPAVNYRFRFPDALLSLVSAAALAATVVLSLTCGYGAEFYPLFTFENDFLTYIPAAVFFVPSAVKLAGGVIWLRLKSKI